MDERVFLAEVGDPVPPWDAKHRLPISGAVGPEIADSGTIFRVNSTYMDVSDQPHLIRQWHVGRTMVGCLLSLLCSVVVFIFLAYPPPRIGALGAVAIGGLLLCAFYTFELAIRFGGEEFFWLRRRPIRFNREARKIYAIRQRRYRNSAVAGDICWEIPWDERSIFCVHRGPFKFEGGERFHIRCYQLGPNGNVARAFAIGRMWQGVEGMRDLLAQWNYWCAYMNSGPKDLPKPMLYLPERETVTESFLCCMYELGFYLKLGPATRTILSPFVLLLTSFRLMSMWTSRDPVWPGDVLDVSEIAPWDIHTQPSYDTPIGWAETERARVEGRYPMAPRCSNPDWSGEADPIVNAERWIEKDDRKGSSRNSRKAP